MHVCPLFSKWKINEGMGHTNKSQSIHVIMLVTNQVYNVQDEENIFIISYALIELECVFMHKYGET